MANLSLILTRSLKWQRNCLLIFQKKFGQDTRVEDFQIEQFFTQLKTKNLPFGQKPKYKVGDLLEAFVNSGFETDSFFIKSGMGVVVDVSYYKCVDYGYDNMSEPFYIIEYKLLMTGEDCYRYFAEEFLKLPKEEFKNV